MFCSCKNDSINNQKTSTENEKAKSALVSTNNKDQELDITVHDNVAQEAKQETAVKEENKSDGKIELIDKKAATNKDSKKNESTPIIKEKALIIPIKKEVSEIKETVAQVEKSPKAEANLGLKNNKEPVLIGKKPENEIVKIKDVVEKKKEVFSHRIWNDLLQANVSGSGKVNYVAFKKSENQLDAYLKLVSQNPPQTNWPAKKEIAYWINAYNAATVKLILKNHPLKSITSLHNGKPWDVKWIDIGGKKYSLNAIENDILRPKFKDARVHFAVNCAAKSCPSLLNKAWTKENLESNYEKQTKSFVNDSNFNILKEKEIEISKIFEWYAKDFGDIITFLNKYSDTKISPKAKISYKEYNWDLNN